MKRDATDVRLGARQRFFLSLLVAAIGCGAGFLYADLYLEPEVASAAGLHGLYASFGAVVALTGFRVSALLIDVLRDIWPR